MVCSELETVVGGPQARAGDVDPTAVETRHGDVEPLAFHTYQVLYWYLQSQIKI